MKRTAAHVLTIILFTALPALAGWQTEHTRAGLYTETIFRDTQTGLACGAKNLEGAKILKTENGGNTWREVQGAEPPLLSVQGIAYEDDNTIYVSGAGGLVFINTLMKSVDAGETWNPVWGKSMFSWWTDIQSIAPDYVIACGYYTRMLITKYCITVSTNGGDKWTEKEWSWNTWPYVAWPTDIFFLDENYGFAAGGVWPWVEQKGGSHIGAAPEGLELPPGPDAQDDWWGIAEVTKDGGDTWETIFLEQGFTLTDVHFVSRFEGWITGYYNSEFDGGNASTYLGWVYHTEDGGETWERQYYGKENNSCMYSVHMFNRREGWLTGYQNQGMSRALFYHTVDGGETWVEDTFHAYADPWELFFFDESEGWTSGLNSAQQTKFLHFADPARDPKFEFDVVASPATAQAGGQLSWTVHVGNISGQAQTSDVWVSVTSPALGGLSPYPVKVIEDVTIPASLNIDYSLELDLPPNTPAGAYCFETIIGPYQDENPLNHLAYCGFDVSITN